MGSYLLDILHGKVARGNPSNKPTTSTRAAGVVEGHENQWVQIFAGVASKGYTWIIQPPARGTNRPPASWHSDSSAMVPLNPNCLRVMRRPLPSGSRQILTCACHCATLKGMRAFS